jgi:DNA primase
LARKAGSPLETLHGGPKGRARDSLLQLYDLLDAAKDHYHRFLLEDPSAQVAREYLKRRGIERASWDKFDLGYSSAEWDGYLRAAGKRGVSPELLEKVGLVRRREQGGGFYDAFRGRLMFPIRDPQSRLIGFGARTLGDDEPKYINTPKTPLFDKSSVLYALPQARAGIQREGRVCIVEGYTDAILAHQAGLDFFVASLGTAFTQENAKRLFRMAPRVLLIFDGDAAGQKATERSLDLLVAESLDVRIYIVKDGKDPCDAILALGGAEFRRRFDEESLGIFEFKWRRTVESEEAEAFGPALKARALDEFLTLLNRVPNVVARKLHLREFAERLGIPEADIEKRMRQLSRKSEFSKHPYGVQSGPGTGSPPALMGSTENVDSKAEAAGRRELEGVILECILGLPEKSSGILAELPHNFFESPCICRIVDCARRLLEAGDFSPARLNSALEDPEAQSVVTDFLSRLDDEQGKPICDYEEVWQRARRDLRRHLQREHVEELKRLVEIEGSKGDTEQYKSLRREYFVALRELKKGGDGA